MKIKLVNVRIHKEAGIIAVDKNVPLYEASILRLMYGEELVDFVNTNTGLTIEVESPHDEYRRLSNLYGFDKERNARRVELIFGFYETGQFEKAFNESIAEEVEDAEIIEDVGFYTKRDGTPFKREADLKRSLEKDGLEGQYEVLQFEDGFVGKSL